MIVFGSTLSPYVRKVMVFGAEKGLDLELEAAGMGRGGPEFMAASPFGKMPGFKDGDFLISDSSAIVAYLDAKYPEPSLIPAEPRARARTIWFDELADTIMPTSPRLGHQAIKSVVICNWFMRDRCAPLCEEGTRDCSHAPPRAGRGCGLLYRAAAHRLSGGRTAPCRIADRPARPGRARNAGLLARALDPAGSRGRSARPGR